MENVSTIELYKQLQERAILNLKENEVKCPECQGLRFILIEEEKSQYIEPCRSCYDGKLKVCKHCGRQSKLDCNCKESYEERRNIFDAKQTQIKLNLYEKAEKINYTDYDGMYVVDNYVKNLEDIKRWIYELIQNKEDIPEYLWGVVENECFSLHLLDIISDGCEEGYEDMYDNLDTESPLLKQAQELINQWKEKQGSRLSLFDEDYKKAIIIKDLVNKIREGNTNGI